MEAERIRKKQSSSDWRRVKSFIFRGGHLTFYHIPTLKPLFTVQQHDNSIHTVDFSPLGDKIATGGKDFHIRVYD